jgi:hypothetical protein
MTALATSEPQGLQYQAAQIKILSLLPNFWAGWPQTCSYSILIFELLFDEMIAEF